MAATRSRSFNFGRWQVERERHQLPAEHRPDAPEATVTIGELAASLLKNTALVGDALARRARPGQLQRAVLTVYVSNAAWLHELSRYGKTELLKKLQDRFGPTRITDLRFQADPDLPTSARRK